MAYTGAGAAAIADGLEYNEAMNRERMLGIDVSRRVLLISHCLRESRTCVADTTEKGIECVSCNELCQVNMITQAAMRHGYRAVCVAPGGSLAIKFIKEHMPLGVVAVACCKELEEGVQAVRELAEKAGITPPAVVTVPLRKDGCVDTLVDVDKALAAIAIGCRQQSQ
jgi:hypothetical protein